MVQSMVAILFAGIMVSVSSTSRWLEFEGVGYPLCHKLDLSGGVDNDEYKYTAPNNIAVVESNVPRWNRRDYYYLSNLFDGSLFHRAKGSDHHHSYWLGQCGWDTATITITFNRPQSISHIVVAARSINNDRYSYYAIDAFESKMDAEPGNIGRAIHVASMVNTDDDHYGKVRAHPVRGTYEVLVFYILKRASYCSLNEIEIFVAD